MSALVHTTRVLPGFALALLTSACATLPAPHPLAPVPDPNALQSTQTLASAAVTATAWPAHDWWRSLGDPQLDRLIDEALADNPSLRVADARTREAIARAGAAAAARAPQVDLGGDATRERFSRNGIYPPPFAGHWDTLSDLSSTLSFDLDLWGGLHNASLAAADSARARSLDARAASLTLSVAVAHAYVELQRDYRALDVARETLAQRERVLALTRERADAGLDSRLEIEQSESALPPVRAQIVRLEEAATRTRHALAALLGQGPDRGLAIERPGLRSLDTLPLPSRLPADLLGRRPDLQAQRWRIESARHGVAAAKAAFYPNVNLMALVGFQNLGPGTLFTAANHEIGVGPALDLPIFDGGRRRATLAAQDAGYDADVAAYEQMIADALREIADHLAAARSIEAQTSEQRQGLATATAAYDLALLRYQEGVGNYLQVLSTESRLLEERALGVDLEARSLDVGIDLIGALGGGYPALESANAH